MAFRYQMRGRGRDVDECRESTSKTTTYLRREGNFILNIGSPTVSDTVHNHYGTTKNPFVHRITSSTIRKILVKTFDNSG